MYFYYYFILFLGSSKSFQCVSASIYVFPSTLEHETYHVIIITRKKWKALYMYVQECN